MLATCGSDIKFYQWPSCSLIATCQHPGITNPSYFRNISWCCHGEQLAAVPSNSYPLIIKPTKANEFKKNIQFTEVQVPQVNVSSFSKTNNYQLTLGCEGGHLFNYNLNEQSPTLMFKFPSGIQLLDHGVFDSSLAVGSKSGQIYIFNSNERVSMILRVPASESLTTLCYHPKERSTLAAGSHEGIVSIWDTNTGNNKFLVYHHSSSVNDLSFSSNDWIFGTVGSDKLVNIYDLRIKEKIFSRLLPHALTAIAFPIKGNQFVVGTANGHVLCFDKRRFPNTRRTFQAHHSVVRQFAYQDENYQDETESVKSCPSAVFLKNVTAHFDQGDYSDSASGSKTINLIWNEAMDKNFKCSFEEKDIPLSPNNRRYSLVVLKEVEREIIKACKEAIDIFAKKMNDEFLKLRMTVNKNFAVLEKKNEMRWNHFHNVLYQLSSNENKEEKSDYSHVSTPVSKLADIESKPFSSIQQTLSQYKS